MSTQAVTPNAPLNALVTKVRAAHPGAYDDYDDAELTKRVLAKYPQYSDLAAPPPSAAPGGPHSPTNPILQDIERNKYAATAGLPGGLPAPANDTMTALAGLGIGAAATAVGGPSILRAAAQHPMITSTIASEAISQARHLPVVGRFIPPYSEMLPFLLGGGKGKEEAPEKILDATGENKPFAGGADEYVAPPQKILDATGENKPFAGGMDEAPPPSKASAPQAILPAQPAMLSTQPAPTAAAPARITTPIEATPAAATSDPILARLRENAANIRAEDAARVPASEEDLTDIGTRSVARAKAMRARGEPNEELTTETEDAFKSRLGKKADDMRARGEQPRSVTPAGVTAKDAYPVKITYDDNGIPTAETDGRHRVIQAIESGQQRIQVVVDRGHGPVETTVDPKVLAKEMGVDKKSLAATDAQQAYRRGNLQPRAQVSTQ